MNNSHPTHGKNTKPKGKHVPATGVKKTAGKGVPKGYANVRTGPTEPHKPFNRPC